MSAPSAFRRWAADEDARLLELRREGLTLEQLAGQLQRGVGAIHKRLEHLRDTPRASQSTRPCLNCRKPFRSAHSMNRLCDRCRRIESSPYQP